MTTCAADAWVDALDAARRDGFAYLDFMTAVDRHDEIELVAHVVDPTAKAHRILTTRIPQGGTIASLTGLFASAEWHEREVAEMFGITFDGHPDPRPLLLHDPVGRPPLLKSAVLAARVVDEWPGAAEPLVASDGRRAGNPSRRAQRPPGAPDDWLDPR